MKTSIINGSEVSRLSVAIQTVRERQRRADGAATGDGQRLMDRCRSQ